MKIKLPRVLLHLTLPKTASLNSGQSSVSVVAREPPLEPLELVGDFSQNPPLETWKDITDVVSCVDSMSMTRDMGAEESANVSEVLQFDLSVVLLDAVNAIDSVESGTVASADESASVSETLTMQFSVVVSDTVYASDDIALGDISAIDSAGVSEVLQFSFDFTVGEAANAVELIEIDLSTYTADMTTVVEIISIELSSPQDEVVSSTEELSCDFEKVTEEPITNTEVLRIVTQSYSSEGYFAEDYAGKLFII